MDYALNGVITNSVNTPPVSMEMKKAIAPYTTLTERLARFVSLIHEGRIDEIEIEYRGAIAEVETNVLTREILSRILATRVKGVNAVNAPLRYGVHGHQDNGIQGSAALLPYQPPRHQA